LPTVAELAQQELSRRYSLQGRTQVAPRVQTMQNARPTVRSALSNLMRDAVDATGLEGGYRQGLLNAAGGVETAVDFLPVIGDALAVEDASRAYGQGDMVGAGINMMGVVPVVGDVAAKGAKSALRGINAYHGSPYKFEKFSMDKIGTGRGLQAYGDGIYFSESSDIARPYSERIFEVNQSLMPSVASFFENDYSISKARAGMKAAHPDATDTEIDNALNEYYMHLDDQGYMYNANLNVGAEDLLDLDAPLSQQPKKVQDMWQKFAKSRQGKASAKENDIEDIRNLVPRYGNEITGEDIRQAIYSGQPVNFNHDFSSNIAPQENKMTSEYLQKQGIKGIRYLNGKYRGAGDGPRNYVIFDDSLIDTKRVNDQPTESWINPEARMQRAQDLGFEEDIYYKGMYPYDYTKESGDYRGPEITEINRPEPFPAFNKGEEGVDIAGFLTKDPEVANRFAGSAGGGAVYPLRYRRGEVYTIDANGRNAGDLQFGESGQEFRDAVRSGNYDTIEIINTADEGDITISTKPENIRSINAEFDPTKADSADLLSSVGTTSALRGIV
jgi:hypothetical protein